MCLWRLPYFGPEQALAWSASPENITNRVLAGAVYCDRRLASGEFCRMRRVQ